MSALIATALTLLISVIIGWKFHFPTFLTLSLAIGLSLLLVMTAPGRAVYAALDQAVTAQGWGA
jgi:DNA-binding IclR family transcriptional regulator